MTKTTTPRFCAACNRRLPPERWVYSQHTGARYCWPGEGCQSQAAVLRHDRRLERKRKETT